MDSTPSEGLEAPQKVVIVTNTTFRMAPWADVLFGMDAAWWKEYAQEAKGLFKGRLVSSSVNSGVHGVERLMYQGKPFDTFGNSGSGAIAMAIRNGASHVILLGYDCQKTDGQAHWHGDHPKKLGNAGSLPRWASQFARLRNAYPQAHIVNCTRETALQAFPRASLEDFL